jgi:tetratricopeptide (TPR) repeat protein
MWRPALSRFACLFLLTTLASTAWPQGNVSTASIIGITRVLRGSFPEPVLVSLRLHGGTIDSAYTDGEGRFSFNFLYANSYHVVIDDDHYMPVDVEVEVRPEVLSVNMLQLTLVPRELNSTASRGTYVVSSSDLVNKYPKKAVKDFERAVKLESQGKIDDATDHYRRALAAAPDFAMAHNNLGALYTAKSEFVPAQKELEESIRLSPGDAKPYFNMGNLMLLAGKVDEVDHYLQEGFRRQPDSAFGFFVKGTALERTGKLPEAETALQRALELEPKMTRPHLELVNLYLREHRSAQAMAELRSFLQIAPKDPLAPKAREVLHKLEQAASKGTRP